MNDKSTYNFIDEALTASMTPLFKEQLWTKASKIDTESLSSERRLVMSRANEIVEKIRCRHKIINLTSEEEDRETILAEFNQLYRMEKEFSIARYIVKVFDRELEIRKSKSLQNSSDGTLLKLPPEMIQHILGYLSIGDIAQLSRVFKEADQLLDTDITKQMLAKRLPESHRKKLSQNYTQVPVRPFLNWLRFAKDYNRNRFDTVLRLDLLYFQPERFVDYLNPNSVIATAKLQPEYQLRLGLACHNENAVIAALKIIKLNEYLAGYAAAYGSWNILNKYFLNENEITLGIIDCSIKGGNIKNFEYAVDHWHCPPIPTITPSAINSAALLGDLKVFEKIISHPRNGLDSPITVQALLSAAVSGNINMFAKILSHPLKTGNLAISIACLLCGALSGKIEMINYILNHPQKEPGVTINSGSITYAILSGNPLIIDEMLAKAGIFFASSFTFSQEDLNSAVATGVVGMFKKIYCHPKKSVDAKITQTTIERAITTSREDMFNELIEHPDRPRTLDVSSLLNKAKGSYDMFVVVCESLKPNSDILIDILNDPDCSEAIKNYVPIYLQDKDNSSELPYSIPSLR